VIIFACPEQHVDGMAPVGFGDLGTFLGDVVGLVEVEAVGHSQKVIEGDLVPGVGWFAPLGNGGRSSGVELFAFDEDAHHGVEHALGHRPRKQRRGGVAPGSVVLHHEAAAVHHQGCVRLAEARIGSRPESTVEQVVDLLGVDVLG